MAKTSPELNKECNNEPLDSKVYSEQILNNNTKEAVHAR